MFKRYFHWLDRLKIGIDAEKSVTLLFCQIIFNAVNLTFSLLYDIDYGPLVNVAFAFAHLYRAKYVFEKSEVNFWRKNIEN